MKKQVEPFSMHPYNYKGCSNVLVTTLEGN